MRHDIHATPAPRNPKRKGVNGLPLGGEAFSSPLLPAPDARPTHMSSTKLGLVVLLSALCAAGTMVAVAMLVADSRAAAVRLAAEERARRKAALANAPPAPLVKAPPKTKTAEPEAPAAALNAPAARPEPEAAQPSREVAARATRSERTVRETRRPATRRRAAAAPRAPAALLEQPTRNQVVKAMRSVTPAVHACFGSTHGKAKVEFTVLGETGRITTATVTGQRGAVGSCIARAVRKARFPKFQQDSLTVAYPFVR